MLSACGGASPPYIPRSSELRRLPLYFYPARGETTPARAVIFFFGNDIGFWQPQRDLADYLAGQNYDVIGFDMKSLLAELPERPSARDSAFDERILPIIAKARHELRADSLPLIVAGHSLGAEVAIWTAAFTKPPRTVGVMAMSPGLRSHLTVSVSDILNSGEPTGASSFSVPEAVGAIAPGVRLTVIRGNHDRYRYADSALVAAGGSRIHLYIVPFASHSLKRIIVARPVIRQALNWMLEPRTPASVGRGGND